MIKVSVNRQSAVCHKSATEYITTGQVGQEIIFEFSEAWDGFSKTAVFKGSGVKKDALLVSDRCEIPHECLTVPGDVLTVGVYGVKGDKVTPTIYCIIDRIKAGADPSGEESVGATPELWQQAIYAAGQANQKAQELLDMAARGEFDGEPGPRGFSGVYVGAGEMPDGYNVQIDPEGDAAPFFEEATVRGSKNLCHLGTVTFERGSGYLEIGSTLEAGKTYTLSAEVTSTDTDSATGVCAVYLATSANVMMSNRYTIARGGRASVTFVCPQANISKIVFYASGTTAGSAGDTATFAYIQIEEGSEATYFVPAESVKVLTAIDYVARRKTEDFESALGESMEVLEETVKNVAPLPSKMDNMLRHEAIPAAFASADFENGGINEAGANTSSTARIRTKGFVEVGAYSTLEYDITDGYRLYLVFFDANQKKISNHGWFTGTGSIAIPESANYYRMQIASMGDATELTADDHAAVAIKYGYAAMTASNDIVTKTNWLAIGDSITFGVYSYMSGESSATGVTDGWVRRLANALGYDITVMASRGMGYTAGVTGQDPNGGSVRISLDTLLTRIEALEEDFNLITMAFGINDYATISQATLETIETGLDNAIERLMAKFPTARLVIITPFNSSRQGNTSTNFAYGYAYSGRSLKDIADLIKRKCESYGIECIYASNGFLINNFNISTLLPDNTHPSDYGHTLIAKNMSRYLLN